MKLNRFYFAALAAMTIASCSNEQDIMVPSSPELKQGEALVTFDVRGNITRADAAEEKAIKSIAYKLYNVETKDSVEINRISTGSMSKIQFKIAADKVNAMNGKPMNLLVAVNSSKSLDVAKLNEALMIMEDKNLENELANAASGLPASSHAIFNMVPGTINISAANKAKRIVSRIYVKKNPDSTGNINGIEIDVRDVANQSYLFNSSYITNVQTEDLASFFVKGEVEQPVAYVYPTESGASVDIHFNGEIKNYPLPKLEKNKNYSITIKVMSTTSGESSGDIEVTIEDWEANTGGNIDADFVETPITPVTLKPGFIANNTTKVESGKLTVKAYGTSEITATELFDGNVSLADVLSVTDNKKTTDQSRANALDKKSNDGVVAARVVDGKLSLTVANTEVGTPAKEYTILIKGTVDGKEGRIALPIVAKSYPENFTVTANGVEVMTVGVQHKTENATDPSTIIAIVEEINQLNGNSFVDKAKEYATKDDGANEAKFMGTRFGQDDDLNAACPAGFEIPTESQMNQFFGLSLTTDNTSFQKISNNATTSIGTGSILLSNTPIKHYIFTPQTGGKVFICGGSKNVAFGTIANNYLLKLTDGTVGRYVFWEDEIQLRVHPNKNVDSWVRCVRKKK